MAVGRKNKAPKPKFGGSIYTVPWLVIAGGTAASEEVLRLNGFPRAIVAYMVRAGLTVNLRLSRSTDPERMPYSGENLNKLFIGHLQTGEIFALAIFVALCPK